jgi:hypothetical protein
MGFTVTMHAYCGMAVPIETTEDLAEARAAAARYLRRQRRADYPVTTLRRGRAWEVQEPEDCILVPDDSGVLVLAGLD